MGLTLSTNVLSFSGISRGIVVRTSMMAERGMLTLGLEAWEAKGAVRESQPGSSETLCTLLLLRGQGRPQLGAPWQPWLQFPDG